MPPEQKRPSDQQGPSPAYDAIDVRQGEIILKTPLRRAIFIGGLVGIVVLPFLLWLLS